METQPLPKPEPESTVIESLLKIKQLFSKNKTENEISDKLSSKFKNYLKPNTKNTNTNQSIYHLTSYSFQKHSLTYLITNFILKSI